MMLGTGIGRRTGARVCVVAVALGTPVAPATAAGASRAAGSAAVLAHVASPGAKGLFHRAIVQAGSFALTQTPVAEAEASGEAFSVSPALPQRAHRGMALCRVLMKLGITSRRELRRALSTLG